MPRAAKAKARSKASSSNSSPGCSTPSAHGEYRERVGNYDLKNLAKTWDNLEKIREQIRDGHNLVRVWEPTTNQLQDQDQVDGNVSNLKANTTVVEPLAVLMKANDLLMPNIDNLIQTVDCFYRNCRHARSLEHSYQMAWGLRRLLVKLKSFCYKDGPPQDYIFCCQYMQIVFVCGIIPS